MTNKSFRIKNDEPEHATIWSIGIGEHFHVHWEEADEDTTYTRQQVENALERGIWTKLEESLPRTFKFKVAGCTEHDDITYTYVESECDCNVFWDQKVRYGVQEIREYIAEGDWVVLPSEPKVNLPEGISQEVLDCFNEMINNICPTTNTLEQPISELKLTIDTKEIFNNYLEQSSDFFSTVKEFTLESGHCVFINNGRYELYRDNEDMPYICRDEEELLAAMNALSVLDWLEVRD